MQVYEVSQTVGNIISTLTSRVSCAAEDSFSEKPREVSTLAENPSEYGTEDREDQRGDPGGRSRHMNNRRELGIGRRQGVESREPQKSEVRYAAWFSSL